LSNLTVFIVDDDPSLRDALGLLLGVRGYRTAVFASAEAFLQAWLPEWAGCLVADIRMSGMDGLTLQRKLSEMNCLLPVIIVTGHGDVSSAREAFKARAVDFLEKPFDDDKLIAAIEEAFSMQLRQRQDQDRRQQRDQLVVMGRHNREIAPQLNISVRTVEVHKARLMAKLGVDNVADLVRVALRD
jgi:FixJ family two-component response regulator